jgi:hypothetical protein
VLKRNHVVTLIRGKSRKLAFNLLEKISMPNLLCPFGNTYSCRRLCPHCHRISHSLFIQSVVCSNGHKICCTFINALPGVNKSIATFSFRYCRHTKMEQSHLRISNKSFSRFSFHCPSRAVRCVCQCCDYQFAMFIF